MKEVMQRRHAVLVLLCGEQNGPQRSQTPAAPWVTSPLVRLVKERFDLFLRFCIPTKETLNFLTVVIRDKRRDPKDLEFFSQIRQLVAVDANHGERVLVLSFPLIKIGFDPATIRAPVGVELYHHSPILRHFTVTIIRRDLL